MAITQVGSTVTHFDAGSPTTLTKSYTQSAGSDKVLVVVVACEGTPAHSTVTFDGNSLMKEVDSLGTGRRTSVWTLKNPPEVTGNIVVTFGASAEGAGLSANSWAGVHQTSPVSNTAAASGSGSTISLTCASDTGELVIDGANIDPTGARTPGAGQTELSDFEVTSDFQIVSSHEDGASPNVSMTWDTSGTWAAAAISLVPMGGGGGTGNTHKVEQLTEQSETSTTFVDVPGTTLTFTPEDTGQIWMIFASGVCRSSVTDQEAFEMRLVINGVEEDLWSHNNNDASTPNGAGFLSFDRITGVDTLQTVKLQYRAIAGTVYADNLRVVVALVPDGADFQYAESDAIVQTTGANYDLGVHQFTPTSAGNYIVLASIRHREFPGGSTSQAWFEDVDAPDQGGRLLHPDAPTNVHHSNARDNWSPLTCVWRTMFPLAQQTLRWRFTSSLNGTEASEHRYRKFMVFREDAFDQADYSADYDETTTTSGTFQVKNSLTTPTPPEARDYLAIQCARIGGDNSLTAQKSGELRAGGTALVRTDLHIDRDNTADQGLHHTIGVVDVPNTDQAVTYENGFLSPDAITVNMAESTIVVLRYSGSIMADTGNTHQMML